MTSPGTPVVDPAATPLARELTDRVRRQGPITVADYMAACLLDPRHGYYRKREPFGVRGDFVTAPEVSQMFGELIGVWAVATWEAMGSPDRFALVELGPGRGTLMADLLRAARVRPAFRAAATVHLVEASLRLRQIQAATLAACGCTPLWHDSLDDVPATPMLVIANEFFDALPIHQLVAGAAGWAERFVAVGRDGALGYAEGPCFALAPPPGPAAPGTTAEVSLAARALTTHLGMVLSDSGGAGIVVDYGYAGPAFGDTLQALYRGQPDHPLAHPGEADLTAHVDFGALAEAATTGGAAVHPLLTQAEFLGRLGIRERAERLAAGKDAVTSTAVGTALRRLTEPSEMGDLFKVLCISSGVFSVPAFDPPERSGR
ncbi:MAG: SAM-dependent methyltransferase [Bauldia sp.]